MTDPEIFIVRIWRQLAGGFRASVRRVDEEEAHLCTAADQVARLFEQVGPPAQDGTSRPRPPLKDAP
jgi:hypothetical protein